jgi:hypothetical protein
MAKLLIETNKRILLKICRDECSGFLGSPSHDLRNFSKICGYFNHYFKNKYKKDYLRTF